MSISFLTDAKNDLYLDADDNIAMGRDLASVLQVCDSVAQTILGECVLDQDVGLPNFETIWNGVPNIAQWETAYRTNIMAIADVLEIVSLVVTIESGQLKYQATIRTTFGTGAANG